MEDRADRTRLAQLLREFLDCETSRTHDEELAELTAIAIACRTSDPAFLSQLLDARTSLADASEAHPNHDVRTALTLARACIGYALGIEVTTGVVSHSADLTLKLKAAANILLAEPSGASVLRQLEPGNAIRHVHNVIAAFAPRYVTASDEERHAILPGVQNYLGTLLPKEPSPDSVREALETIQHRGGPNAGRGKWNSLASLLRSGGIQVEDGDSLRRLHRKQKRG